MQSQIALPARFKPALRSLRFAYRRATSRQRLLPDFIIAGAQKAGSTSLFRYLAQHPGVAPTLSKEVHYFDNNFAQGLNWYRSHFALSLAHRQTLAGEASPYYLDHPLAAQRCFQTIPDVRIIFLLRDPIARTLSHYHHAVRQGFEPLPSFEEALAAEPERLAGEVERMQHDPAYYSFAHHHLSYRTRSHYADHLERWLSHYPRERICIVQSERMLERPDEVLQEILEFLRLPSWRPARFDSFNQGHYRPQIAPTTEAWLTREFASSNERLFRLLARRFAWSQSSACAAEA